MSSPDNNDSNNGLLNNLSVNEDANVSDSHRTRQVHKTKLNMIIHNIIANIFIKEVNLILCDDSKDNFHTKNNIASIILDDFIICYAEKVRTWQFLFVYFLEIYSCLI